MGKILNNLINGFVNRIWMIAVVVLLIVNSYWAWFATDRYVSKAHIVLQSPEISPPEFSFSSMLSGASGGNTADLLLFREHLLSMDMLRKLELDFNLKSHFSNEKIDYFSRLPSGDLPLEQYFEYYLDRVNIRLDDYSGVLIVEAQMFTPQMAQKIVARLLDYGEMHMNAMGQRLAEEQVAFIEKQVNKLSKRLIEANQNVLQFQNDEGLLSPSDTAVSMSAVISELQAELISLKAKRSALRSFQSSESAEIQQIDTRITSLQEQVDKVKNTLTSPSGHALNEVSLQYESLKLKAQFAQQLYANALATLETTRVEAARKLKQVSIIAEPNFPEYSVKPDRSYMIALNTILILLVTLIINMVVVIVKDHKD